VRLARLWSHDHAEPTRHKIETRRFRYHGPASITRPGVGRYREFHGAIRRFHDARFPDEC
jgi:hypothetical protein